MLLLLRVYRNLIESLREVNKCSISGVSVINVDEEAKSKEQYLGLARKLFVS